MAKQNLSASHEQIQALKYVDYLVSNMPATALGQGHPIKCLYAIPDEIYGTLLDCVEEFKLEEISPAYLELRDNMAPGRITSLPMNDYLSNLCTGDGKIYPFDEINWLDNANERKIPVNQPSIAELNQAKLTFIDYLIEKIPTLKVRQPSGLVSCLPEGSLNIIEKFVDEFNMRSAAYKNLRDKIENTKVFIYPDAIFMAHLLTQEIKPISEGIEIQTKLVPNIEALIDKSVIFNLDTGAVEITKSAFNLIHKIVGESNLEFSEFDLLSDQVVDGRVKLIADAAVDSTDQ